ncbi:MAG: hypothetical protein ACI4WR_10640 [Bulleidia sp.]
MDLLETELLNYPILSAWIRQRAPGSLHPAAAAVDQEKNLEELDEASILLRELDWHPCLIGCGELSSSVLYALYHCGFPLKRQDLAETCSWIGMNRAEADRLFYELWIGHEESGTYAILTDRLSEPIARAVFTLYGPDRFCAADSAELRAGMRRMGAEIREQGTLYGQYQAECLWILEFCSLLSEEMEQPVSFQEASFLMAFLKDLACSQEPLYPIGSSAALSCMVQEMYRNLPGSERRPSESGTGLSETERILTAMIRDCSL